MRFTLLASLVGVIAGLAGGGRLSNLGRASFRGLVLLAAGLAGSLFVAVGNPPHGHAILVGSTAALALFAAVNLVRFPGMGLVGLGLLLNLVVVTLNHGMPYRPEALDAAGIERPASTDRLPRTVRHHPAGPDDRLTFLGETIPLAPLQEVDSVGTILIGLGAAGVLTNALVRTRRRDRPRHLRPTRRSGRRRAAAGPGPAGGVMPAADEPSVVLDLTGDDLVLDLTRLGDGAPLHPARAAGGADLPIGDEFWTARAALLDGPEARVDPLALLGAAAGDGDQPGDLFWRTRAALAGPADVDPPAVDRPGDDRPGEPRR
jgi:hypothetical protein